jgi:hypothetical protein
VAAGTRLPTVHHQRQRRILSATAQRIPRSNGNQPLLPRRTVHRPHRKPGQQKRRRHPEYPCPGASGIRHRAACGFPQAIHGMPVRSGRARVQTR